MVEYRRRKARYVVLRPPACVNGTGSCNGASVCTFACSSGYKHCGASDATGCETHTDVDSSNCGSCGNVCPFSEQCAGGSCQCDPAKVPSQDPCVVTETLGLFVAPAANGGNDGAAGTRAAPFATIGHAIVAAKAAGKRVYACAGAFDEQVVVNASVDGVSIYGGLVCPGGASPWSYTGAKAIVAPSVFSATGYPLHVDALTTGVTFEDFEFDAHDGANPGDSSIAVFATSANGVVFRRVKIQAGIGD